MSNFELQQRIKRQVEFYFGDANMRRDAFLIGQTKLDDGWVPMSIMLKFRMLANLSRNVEVILQALENSDLIEIHSDRTKIRRKTCIVDSDRYSKTDQKARTVYVKGFPRNSDIQELIGHFETNYSVEHVFLKKEKVGGSYVFDGSLYLQFKTKWEAQNFIDQSFTTYKNNTLSKTWAPESYYVGKC